MTDSPGYDRDSGATVELNQLVQEILAFSYNATEELKEALLSLLKDPKILELLGAWRKTDPRAVPRKPCFLVVRYLAQDEAFTDVIRNITTGGLFIETSTLLPLGEEIRLIFPSLKPKEPIETTGKIVWSGPAGIGVKFTTQPGPSLKKLIEAL